MLILATLASGFAHLSRLHDLRLTGHGQDSSRPPALGSRRSRQRAFFRQALDLGINFGTRQRLLGGDSEIVIGRFLRQNNIRRESMVIATKVCSPMRGAQWAWPLPQGDHV